VGRSITGIRMIVKNTTGLAPRCSGRDMKDSKKTVPNFDSEEDERGVGATADSTEYFDWSLGRREKLSHPERSRRTCPRAPSLERKEGEQ
jgi:hypothetical protein